MAAMSFLLLSALLLQPTDCPSPAVNLPPALRPWEEQVAQPGPLLPGRVGTIPTGQAVTLRIAEAGTYGVALGIGAWIDVARDGRSLDSVGHGHGPACSTIRKIVDFRLEPGTYTVTLSRTTEPAARIFVFRR